MLDINSKTTLTFKESAELNFNEKLKNKINSKITSVNARRLSFISLASLVSACNFGGSSDTVAPLNISAIKGPLSNALAFVDRDGDGVFDDGEEFAITGSTGAATITPNSVVSATDTNRSILYYDTV